MIDINPILKLTYLKGSNPKKYALNISINENSSLKMIEPTVIQKISSDGLTVNVQINMTSQPRGKNSVDIDLSHLILDDKNGLVEVTLKSTAETNGSGVVRAEEAQQESRPIGV